MTNEETYLTIGVVTMVLHELKKMKAFSDRFQALGQPFVFSKFMKDEWTLMLSAVLSVVLIILFVPALINLDPRLEKVISILSGFAGWFGASAIEGIFYMFGQGTASKIIQITKDKVSETSINTGPDSQ